MAALDNPSDSKHPVILTDLELGSVMDVKTSKSKRKKSQWCSAINCTNGRYECPGLSFFRFPRDEERCKKWLINCRRQDLLCKSPRELYTSNVLCAIHFEDSEYTDPHRRNRLKPLKAVPTIFNIPNPPPKFANRRPAPRKRKIIATGEQNSPSSSLQPVSTEDPSSPGL
ncbi:52 kda repressor of the inhibitor of the protein kinase [Plakobranchus ocellatus]|uniref:52 kDa repressor of the inhibitor of the protein kinase n=1 Tax=Plakobranchus ocellatus TaxID=259542 RepID=A0AAV4AIM4_9GAST|nr:52 kda repressor of the inhibitor of the protein kinase [Plakobranchus ocellatus]